MSAPRKRLPVLRPVACLTGRDAVWQAIRDLSGRTSREFTREDIKHRVEAGKDLISDHVRRLTRAGIIEIVGTAARPQSFPLHRYRLVRDVGVEPPRITATGQINEVPTTHERLWQAMKALPTFGVTDLQAGTGITSLPTIKVYVHHLLRAGYLVVVERASSAGRARYRLLNSGNTGPRPPAIRRDKSVFDLNLGRQVWPEVKS